MMTNITKKGLDNNLSNTALNNLLKEIKKCENADDFEIILNNLFTPQEKIMLKKRLAIKLLIKNGKGNKEISKTLDVSRVTVDFIKRGLKKLPQKPIRKNKKISRNDYTEKLRHQRQPTYSGRNRWSFLNKPQI
jgi:uncharacterized protein YerC